MHPLQIYRTSWRVRRATPEDWKSFSSLVDTYLKNVQPADLPQISSSHHTTSNIIEYVWNRIKTAFTTAASIAIGKHDNNRSYEFWWQHPEVTKAKQQLSKARRKFNKSPNSQNKLLLKSANKHFKTTATAVKSKLWNSFSQQLQNGKSINWTIFNRSKPKDISSLSNFPSGQLPQCLTQSLNNAGDVFAQVFKAPPPNLQDSKSTDSSAIQLHNSILHTITSRSIQNYNSRVSETTLDFALTKVNYSSVSGLDNIHPHFLRHLGPIAKFSILFLFNLSLSFFYLPSEWKIAKIILFFKNGSRSDPNSYRPISITSIMARLLEHMVLNKLNNFLVKQQVISPFQFGFRPKHSTYDCLFRLTSTINTTLL